MPFRFSHGRPPAVALNGMVATSQPLATRAGLRILERGGNAADAALAAAAVLCVTEPMSTGIGGDCFALVWSDGRVVRARRCRARSCHTGAVEPVEERGPRSITVPGAVRGWAALAERFGRLGLDDMPGRRDRRSPSRASPSHPITAMVWAAVEAPPELGPVPRVGDRVRLPELGATLRAIASEGPDAFYTGRIGQRDCRGELARRKTTWADSSRAGSIRCAEPIATSRCTSCRRRRRASAPSRRSDSSRGSTPDPPEQGHVGPAGARGRAGARSRRRRRASSSSIRRISTSAERCCAHPCRSRRAGRSTCTVVDGDRMAVSFIQSLYMAFGSGVVAPGTGVALQNRGACFSVSGRVEPGTRPYHTIIPGMLAPRRRAPRTVWRDGRVHPGAGPHAARVRLVDDGLDPQAALERRGSASTATSFASKKGCGRAPASWSGSASPRSAMTIWRGSGAVRRS